MATHAVATTDRFGSLLWFKVGGEKNNSEARANGITSMIWAFRGMRQHIGLGRRRFTGHIPDCKGTSGPNYFVLRRLVRDVESELVILGRSDED